MADKIYAKWLYFNDRHEKAPEFVLGSISIKIDTLEELCKQAREHESNWYCKFDVLKWKEKPSVVVNTYKKEEKREKREDTFIDCPF